jgi:hypothetical protein
MIASIGRSCASLLAAVLIWFNAMPVLADELIVMPYACSMVGGRPVLAPSREETHRVIGGRERQIFTACSAANPNLCRSWMVHRFDLDCAGTRVPWLTVVAAAAELLNKHAFIQDGRLHLRMGNWWDFAPDDPCAGRQGYDDRSHYGRLGRYCADRRALTPPSAVVMPTGFAPMLGIAAQFITLPPATSRTGVNSPPPPLVAKSPPSKTPRSAPPITHIESAPVVVGPTKSESTSSSEPTLSPGGVAPKTAHAGSAPVLGAKEAPTKVEAPSSHEPARQPGIVPKIINRADESTRQGTLADMRAADSTDIAKIAANDAKSTQKFPESVTPAPKEYQDTGRDGLLAVSLLDTGAATTSAVVTFAGLTIILLAAFTWARRRERARLARMANREIAAVSLDDRYDRTDTSLALAAQFRRHVSATELPAQHGWRAPQGWGDRLPTTRAEALEFLNVGPDAKEGAIKKIIDGLRQSWHPDHANGEPDRHLRETRLKQINVAWEIICGKRAEA